MKSRLFLTTAILAAACGLCADRANANTFSFSYQLGNENFGVSASGTLTTTDTPINGAYTITGITGSRTVSFEGTPDATQAITGLLQPDTAYGSTDLLYTDAPYLDDSGFTYTLQSGSVGDDFNGDVNFSYFNGAYQEPIEGLAHSGSFTLTSASDTPEPASFGLLASAVLAALGFCITRRRTATR